MNPDVIRLARLMKFDCWIQTADFEVTQHNQQDPKAALSLFESCDWERLIEFEWKLSEQKIEYASPGFGIDHPEGHRIHICPYRDGSCLMFYEPTLNRKFLGFLPIPDPCYQSDDLNIADVPVVIETFCAPSSAETLIRHLQNAGHINS